MLIRFDVGMGVESHSLGEKDDRGSVIDQALFCMGGTNSSSSSKL